MKFTCTQNNLVRGLSQVVPIAGRNSQLPVLKYVLLQVKNHVLHLTTTDLEVGVHAIIGGKMLEEGDCVVLARSFLDYIQQLPSNQTVTLEYKDNVCKVTSRGFKAQFPTLSADDFPLLPDVHQENSIALEPRIFCDALANVVFAASREEVRPEIRSVFVRVEGEKVTVAATDSFRLSEYVTEYSGDQKFQCILPLPSAQEVIRLFSDQEAMVILPHDNHITFQSDGVEMSTRLVDGVYPDYGQIIPTSWQTRLHIEKEAFLRALKTLTVFLSKDLRRVQFQVSGADSAVLLQVSGSESGQGNVELEAEVEGDDLMVLVNIQYVIEGLQHIHTKDVEVWFGGEFDPVIVRPSSKESTYTYVVMPIQA